MSTQQVVIVKDNAGEIVTVFLVLTSGLDVSNQAILEKFVSLRARAWDEQKLQVSIHEPVRANTLDTLEFLIKEMK